jgi:hypothetical protein
MFLSLFQDEKYLGSVETAYIMWINCSACKAWVKVCSGHPFTVRSWTDHKELVGHNQAIGNHMHLERPKACILTDDPTLTKSECELCAIHSLTM